MKRLLIAPSILAADFGNLRAEVRRLDRCRVDGIHIDVMDGHFVPNIAFGPAAIAAIRNETDIPFETHLMIKNPGSHIKRFADAGSDMLIVHKEAEKDMEALTDSIRALGVKAGIAINPETPLGSVKGDLGYADLLLIMSVHPGFGGQKFISGSLRKIKEARSQIIAKGYRTIISVDGGIDLRTGRMAVSAGADELVAGTAIFQSKDISRRIGEFRSLG